MAAGISSCERKSVGRVEIPDYILFAGDTINLAEADLRERLEREILINQYWHSNTSMWIRKSGFWFPFIDSLLKANKVPGDLRYLVAIESGFENVISPKGAAGFWQLMEATALESGLVISPCIDERFDPGLSGKAASILLTKGYQEFKSWPAAAVAFNMGIHGLRSVMKAQYTDSVFDLLLNQESGRYFFRILAAKLILENPAQYGFEVPKVKEPYSFQPYEITDSIPDLPWWCRNRGFSYKCFRLLNPWIRADFLRIPAGRKSIKVRLPLNCALFTSQLLPPVPATDSEIVQNRNTDALLVLRKDIAGFEQSDHNAGAESAIHIVQRGESLSLIARKYAILVSDLFALNPGLSESRGVIRDGEKLRVK